MAPLSCAKPDKINAKVLLRFAQQKQFCRQQLLPHRSSNSPKSIHRSIQRMIPFVENEIDRIDKQLRKVINENDSLRAKAELIASVKGVGEVTTWTILAYLSEMTHLKRNQLVALAGLAPYNRDSGKSQPKRSIKGGPRQSQKMPLYGCAHCRTAQPSDQALCTKVSRQRKTL